MKILVALDFSPSAHLVAEQAQVMAASMDAELHLIHVLADWTYYSGMNYSPILGYTSIDFGAHQAAKHEELHLSAMNYLEKTKDYLDYKNTHLHVLDGVLYQVVNDFIEKNNIDYLVIGSHSRSKFENIIMGSNTEKMLSNAQIPTVVVPVRNYNEEV